MGVRMIDTVKYGGLCAQAAPKIIENNEELERFSEVLERISCKRNAGREEQALAKLLERLIQDYDERNYPTDIPPRELILYLMEHRDLRQADLLPVFGSRSVASAVLNGKREISKAHARKLAEYFRLPVDLFI